MHGIEHGGSAGRRWAIYAGPEGDALAFAAAVHAAGSEWKPLAVEPVRLLGAVAAIQPDVVVISAGLPLRRALARQVRQAGREPALVLPQAELGRLTEMLAAR